jgi:integrase
LKRFSRKIAKEDATRGLRPKATHTSQGKGRGARRIAHALSFHSLRHTTTSLLRDAGVSQSVAMGFVGHASPAINQQYTHVGNEALRKAADSLPDLG